MESAGGKPAGFPGLAEYRFGPEWPVAVPSRSHQPLVHSLTEAALDAPLQEVGDGVPLRQEPWHFELTEMKIGDEEHVAVWRRVS